MAEYYEYIPYSRIAKISPVLALSGETMSQLVARVGCQRAINGGTYNLVTRALDSGLKLDGEYLKEKEQHGLAVTSDGRLAWQYKGNWANTWFGYYSVGVGNGTVMGKHLTDARQRTGVGYDSDGIYLAAVTQGMTTAAFGAKYFSDCKSWVNLDGGASTQWVGEDSRYISSRKVVWYLCVWLKDEDTGGDRMSYSTNLPLNGEIEITAAFGEVNARWSGDHKHKGIDLISTSGAKTIYSPCEGTVRVVSYDSTGYGQYVSIGTTIGGVSHIVLLCHMVKGSVKVKAGQKVTRYTVIGTMGATGNCSGVHLHLQLNTMAGVPVDPTALTHLPNARGVYLDTDYKVDASGNLIQTAVTDTAASAAEDEVMTRAKTVALLRELGLVK